MVVTSLVKFTVLPIVARHPSRRWLEGRSVTNCPLPEQPSEKILDSRFTTPDYLGVFQDNTLQIQRLLQGIRRLLRARFAEQWADPNAVAGIAPSN